MAFRSSRRISTFSISVSTACPILLLFLCVILMCIGEHAFLRQYPLRFASWNTENVLNPLKRIVVAAHYNENVSWLDEVSRHWQVTIMGPGGLPANKGNEAMPYLTYIIENYNNLPESMAFIHSHQFSWHTPQSQLETLVEIPCWENVPYASITSTAINGK